MTALVPYYPWLKSFHIISIVAWMAALLYLPRLYVYHSTVPVGSDSSNLFKTMERRLLRGIMNPAMIATFIFGLLLASIPGIVDMHQFWFPLKILLVLGLAAYHGMLSAWRKQFERDERPKTQGFFRLINEVPAVALVIIVILVVVKPF